MQANLDPPDRLEHAVQGVWQVVRSIESDVKDLDAKFDALDARLDVSFTDLSGQIGALDTKLDATAADLSGRIDALDTKFDAKFDTLDAKVDAIARAVGVEGA